MSELKVRAAFEDWMLNTRKFIVGSNDPYPAGMEREYWTVWQAAWTARAPEPGQPAAGQIQKGHERYRVEPTKGGFWPYQVLCGNGTRPLFIGQKKNCDRVAMELACAYEDGLFLGSKPPSQPERGIHVSPEISDAARSVQDKKDLEELRPFYSREGVTALLEKYWPDILGEAEPVARVGLAAHTLVWLSEEYFSSVPIGTLLYIRPAPRAAVPEDARRTSPAIRYQPMSNAPKEGYFLAWDARDNIWAVVKADVYWGWGNLAKGLIKIYKEEAEALSCWTDLPPAPEQQGEMG